MAAHPATHRAPQRYQRHHPEQMLWYRNLVLTPLELIRPERHAVRVTAHWCQTSAELIKLQLNGSGVERQQWARSSRPAQQKSTGGTADGPL
jgi:hypothetical protein